MTQHREMVEISNANIAATLLDHSEGSNGSFGFYNDTGGDFNLPNYMNHAPPRNYVIYQLDVL